MSSSARTGDGPHERTHQTTPTKGNRNGIAYYGSTKKKRRPRVWKDNPLAVNVFTKPSTQPSSFHELSGSIGRNTCGTNDKSSNTALDTKLIQLLDSKFSILTQHQQNISRPISAATPLGATISNGLPELLQSPPISNVLGGAPGNSPVVPNDYDKARGSLWSGIDPCGNSYMEACLWCLCKKSE